MTERGARHGCDQGDKPMESYKTKFAEFIRMCEDAKRGKLECIVIAYPHVLGDTYEELIESLGRLAQAGVPLRVAKASPEEALEE